MWFLLEFQHLLQTFWTKDTGRSWVNRSLRFEIYTICPLWESFVPQNSRRLEWEKTPGEESRREFSNVGPSLDAVDPRKLNLLSPAPPQPQGLLTQWGPGMCVFQMLLEEFRWASRGQTLNLHQEAKAHRDLPLPQSRLAIMCQAQVYCHRPHQGAEAIRQNSLWQVSASPHFRNATSD